MYHQDPNRYGSTFVGLVARGHPFSRYVITGERWGCSFCIFLLFNWCHLYWTGYNFSNILCMYIWMIPIQTHVVEWGISKGWEVSYISLSDVNHKNVNMSGWCKIGGVGGGVYSNDFHRGAPPEEVKMWGLGGLPKWFSEGCTPRRG